MLPSSLAFNLSTATVLVTGGCGFIGSEIVRQLMNNHPGCRVVNLDSLEYAGNPENVASVASSPRYRFIQGDIRDASVVESALAGVDAIIHTAAQTHVDRSITGPTVFWDTNVMGTQSLVEAARKLGIQKFIHVSTDEVYGSLSTGHATEDTPLNPTSPYAASKAASDLLMQSAMKTYGFPACITRCSNNYGPYQYPEKLIPLFIFKALRDETLPLYGDGLHERDWIHVSDHAAGILKVLEAGNTGEIYNLGATNPTTNKDLIEHILEMLGKPASLITPVADRPAHDRRYAIDSTKSRSQLGWKATIPFEQGLADTLAWYQSNPQWLESVRKRAEALNHSLEQGLHIKSPVSVSAGGR
ncbi:MAG: dTDP-glucose 4,6-dehydratase [Vampirovibrionales bacterium]|nr:dTDP-glucose 4,6-dehydratase [Vampirovibrionales bacterium]